MSYTHYCEHLLNLLLLVVTSVHIVYLFKLQPDLRNKLCRMKTLRSKLQRIYSPFKTFSIFFSEICTSAVFGRLGGSPCSGVSNVAGVLSVIITKVGTLLKYNMLLLLTHDLKL